MELFLVNNTKHFENDFFRAFKKNNMTDNEAINTNVRNTDLQDVIRFEQNNFTFVRLH